MKAYKISDLKGYADYSTVVFAETSGKAKAIAITTDAFNDYEFTEISARRVPKLDKYYRVGKKEINYTTRPAEITRRSRRRSKNYHKRRRCSLWR